VREHFWGRICPSILCVSLLALCSAASDGADDDAVTVEVGCVRQLRLAPQTWTPGSIMSRNDARLASVVAGRLVEISDVGDRVAVGAKLAKLDDTVFKLHVQDLESQLARVRAQQTLLRTTLERYRKLAVTSVLPRSQLDEAQAQLDMATHDIERLMAQLGQARYDQAQSELRAPFSGVIVERYVQRGEFVQVGSPVVRLVDTSRTEARVTASLSLAANVQVGLHTPVRAHGEERRGTIRAVVPVGDERSRQFEIRVALEDSDWLVGTAVDVRVPTGPARLALVVPRDALVLRDGRAYVMRINMHNLAEKIEVSAGDPLSDVVEVKGSLAAGERVVVRGAERIASGDKVSISVGHQSPPAPTPGEQRS
jgi:RND family efflux transporter MFP subunit